MSQLLHLPDLAAARPPARRRRGPAVALALAAGAARGRVVRVADPVRREARVPVQPPPLLAAPAAGRRGDDNDDEDRQRYYLNMGYAIRTLREELPDVLCKEHSFDIYRDDIVFRDPLNTFKGLGNYKRLFRALRLTGRFFFKASWVEVVNIWQPAENTISVRWTAHGVPRVPWGWDGPHARFDGASVYKLDRDGKIYEHKVHNVALNPPPPAKSKVLPVHELVRSLGCPSTAEPTCSDF